MGAGYHGGFGTTAGSKMRAFPGAVKLVKKGEGEAFGRNAAKAKPLPGYTDVIIHGRLETDRVSVFHNGGWVDLDQRRLASFIKKNSEYKNGPIRLISCNMGAKDFAQHLANKIGVEVMAPSDTVWAFPNGKLTIGPNQFANTGTWKVFKPRRGGH